LSVEAPLATPDNHDDPVEGLRNVGAERELTMMRGGMPPPPKSP
jgi:hypothetical protein